MKSPASVAYQRLVPVEQVQAMWQSLAHRFFENRLPLITIEWSARLTSLAGLFVSEVGPGACGCRATIGRVRLGLSGCRPLCFGINLKKNWYDVGARNDSPMAIRYSEASPLDMERNFER